VGSYCVITPAPTPGSHSPGSGGSISPTGSRSQLVCASGCIAGTPVTTDSYTISYVQVLPTFAGGLNANVVPDETALRDDLIGGTVSQLLSPSTLLCVVLVALASCSGL
jgi:hypothetical protein